MSLNYVQSMGLAMVRFGVLPILATAIGLALASCSPPQTEVKEPPREETSAENAESAARAGYQTDQIDPPCA